MMLPSIVFKHIVFIFLQKHADIHVFVSGMSLSAECQQILPAEDDEVNVTWILASQTQREHIRSDHILILAN